MTAKKVGRAFWALLLALLLPVGTARAAVSGDALWAVIDDVARCVQHSVPTPQVAAVGGEWAVIGLARSGCEVEEGYLSGYCDRLEETLVEKNGVLHERKYTEYARAVLAVSALGRDARDVGGWDLTLPLADYGQVLRQGLNGPIWALIALDSANYPMPVDPRTATQATRQMYVDEILARQLPGGGWSLSGAEPAQADLTAMALQALAPYRAQDTVVQAVDRALACLSALQDGQGGYCERGVANAESCAQVVTALATLGIEQDDPRFVKNGSSALDALLGYYTPGQGFSHSPEDTGPSLMASEQGLYALVAVHRLEEDQTGLYDMTDVMDPRDPESPWMDPVARAVQAALWCVAVMLP